jgi:hypothetical protein
MKTTSYWLIALLALHLGLTEFSKTSSAEQNPPVSQDTYTIKDKVLAVATVMALSQCKVHVLGKDPQRMSELAAAYLKKQLGTTGKDLQLLFENKDYPSALEYARSLINHNTCTMK